MCLKLFLKFFQAVEGDSVIKKVIKYTVTIITHERNLQQYHLSVLGVEHLGWREGDSVIFHSSYATTKVKLR
ncbi:hypothetical protein [Lysinibacillus fusiformis]|uniref:hypothetical protein n=1 Tax=Lysinibacillus fusiformis TaxID=28031 RepID=UPI001EF5C632|nr:hypothetical protein [Lysinibacillus fusiformis]MCG7436074.1 hypothetical protein [Lysinibacillus fusiformis]